MKPFNEIKKDNEKRKIVYDPGGCPPELIVPDRRKPSSFSYSLRKNDRRKQVEI